MGGVIKWSDFAILRTQAPVGSLSLVFDLPYSSIQCPFSVYRERLTEAGHTMQNPWWAQVLRTYGSELFLHFKVDSHNDRLRSKTFWCTCNLSTIHSSILPSFERSRFHHEVLVKRLVVRGSYHRTLMLVIVSRRNCFAGGEGKNITARFGGENC